MHPRSTLTGARMLGLTLGKAGIAVVYGGTTRGLMGVVADAALKAGGLRAWRDYGKSAPTRAVAFRPDQG